MAIDYSLFEFGKSPKKPKAASKRKTKADEWAQWAKERKAKVGPICEAKGCRRKSVDAHHIKAKGMGGSKAAHSKDNMILLCRKCHNLEHGIKSGSKL